MDFQNVSHVDFEIKIRIAFPVHENKLSPGCVNFPDLSDDGFVFSTGFQWIRNEVSDGCSWQCPAYYNLIDNTNSKVFT